MTPPPLVSIRIRSDPQPASVFLVSFLRDRSGERERSREKQEPEDRTRSATVAAAAGAVSGTFQARFRRSDTHTHTHIEGWPSPGDDSIRVPSFRLLPCSNTKNNDLDDIDYYDDFVFLFVPQRVSCFWLFSLLVCFRSEIDSCVDAVIPCRQSRKVSLLQVWISDQYSVLVTTAQNRPWCLRKRSGR